MCNFINYRIFQHRRDHIDPAHSVKCIYSRMFSRPSLAQKPAVWWIYNTLIMAFCDNIFFQSCSNLISNLDDCLSRGGKQRTRGKMFIRRLYLEKFSHSSFWTDLNRCRHTYRWLANEKSRTPKWNKSTVISFQICSIMWTWPIFSLAFLLLYRICQETNSTIFSIFTLAGRESRYNYFSGLFFPNEFLSLFSRRSSPCLSAAIRAQCAQRAQLRDPHCGARRASRCPFNLPTAGSLVIMGLQ